MATQCLDDPATILQKEWCVSALSKDLSGTLTLVDSKTHQCHTPTCKTLKTVHTVKVTVVAHAPCDSQAAHALDGDLGVGKLITAFDQDGTHRGVHAGDFVWHGAAGIQVTGRMSGVTNVGSHRPPAFPACQKCDDRGVMEGRLCGQIVEPEQSCAQRLPGGGRLSDQVRPGDDRWARRNPRNAGRRDCLLLPVVAG